MKSAPTILALVMAVVVAQLSVVVQGAPGCCEQLGWSFGYGSKLVCAATEGPSAVCSGRTTLQGANNYCMALGGRLCTLDELLNSETKETGCGYDMRPVWSSTPCAGGFARSYGDPALGGELVFGFV